jgi:polygalacturonase
MTTVQSPKRRSLLRASSASALLLSAAAPSHGAPIDPWRNAQRIAARVGKPLKFRKQDFDITRFGAKPCELVDVNGFVASEVPGTLRTPAPGAHDSRPAIDAAIVACHKAGGGRVLLPAGNWYCKGPMVLRSNVHVHLAAGAQIFFSANHLDYAKYGDIDCGEHGKLVRSRWQGNDCLNYSPMIYAYGQKNIALTGADWTSILNGQGGVPFETGVGCWWDWKGRPPVADPAATEIIVNPRNAESLATVAPGLSAGQRQLIEGTDPRWRSDSRYLPALSEAGVPLARRIFGIGHYLRPCMIEVIGCTDVHLEGYQINGSPFWLHHPVNSRNVHIRKVKLESLGPNSDGFDPEACDGVLVDGCTFNSGDDCIAIKSGKNLDTTWGPTRNVVIQNCIMNSGHGAVTLGSEMAAGIEHVYAQDLEFRNIHWATDPLNTAIRMKTNMNRGGYLRHFYVRRVSIPNGVQVAPSFYPPLPGSVIKPKSVASTAGGIITIDCDYAPAADDVRIRPPVISDIHISQVKVGNVKTADGQFSCYQAMVILGPVASSYNGKPGKVVLPVTNVTITDCDFGTPRNAGQPWYLHNVKDVVLKNVVIDGKTVSTVLNDKQPA